MRPSSLLNENDGLNRSTVLLLSSRRCAFCSFLGGVEVTFFREGTIGGELLFSFLGSTSRVGTIAFTEVLGLGLLQCPYKF